MADADEKNPFDLEEDDDWADAAGSAALEPGAEDELLHWADEDATDPGQGVQSASTSDEGGEGASPSAAAAAAGAKGPTLSSLPPPPPADTKQRQDEKQEASSAVAAAVAEQQVDAVRQCDETPPPAAPAPEAGSQAPASTSAAPEAVQQAVEEEKEQQKEEEALHPASVRAPTPCPPSEDVPAVAVEQPPNHPREEDPEPEPEPEPVLSEEVQHHAPHQEQQQQQPPVHHEGAEPQAPPVDAPPADQQQPQQQQPEPQQEEEISDDVTHADEEQPASRSSGGGAAPWGWSAGWGLNALGGTLRAVAAGAVRDVRELTGSLQQALAEVREDDEDDDDNHSGRVEEVDQRGQGADAGECNKQQQQQQQQEEGVVAVGAGGAPRSPPRQQEAAGEAGSGAADPGGSAAAQAVAPPGVSQGGSGSATAPRIGPREAERGEVASEPPQVQPEADRTSNAPPPEGGPERGEGSGDGSSGLSDLDEVDQRMEQLATGAVKALSNLWGGLSGVARNTATLVSKVEAATLEIAKDLVSGSGVTQDMQQLQSAAATGVRGVAVNVTSIGTRLEAGLETVGRTALGLLEEVTGQHRAAAVAAGGGHGGAGDAGGAASGPARQVAQRTFDELFDLYGGQQLSEDLENLANECARIANKARTRLEEGQQGELDKTMALLGPLFSTPLTPATTNATSKATAPTAGAPGPPAALVPGSEMGGREEKEGGGVGVGGNDVDAEEDEEKEAWLVQDEAARAAQEQLEQRYEPVGFLCQDSATRARGFRELLLAAAREQQDEEQQQQQQQRLGQQGQQGTAGGGAPPDTAVSGEAQSAIGAAPQAAEEEPVSGQVAGGATEAQEEKEKGKEEKGEEGAQQDNQQQQQEEKQEDGEDKEESLLRAALQQVRGHMFKRLAELATAQLQLLLDHGINLAAPARSADIPAGSSITWPEQALPQARLLQRQARLMAKNMHAVGHLYTTVLQDTLDQAAAARAATAAAIRDVQVPGATEQPSLPPSRLAEDLALCAEALQQLKAARSVTVGALEEAFRGLLYPVLVRELVLRIAGSE